MDRKVDGGMNVGVDREMDGGMDGGMDGIFLLEVKHVCVETSLKKEKDCPPPCLFDRGKRGGDRLSSSD